MIFRAEAPAVAKIKLWRGKQRRGERLLEVARPKGREAPQTLVEHILASVEAFAGQADQADDITLLAVRYRGGTANR
jgi:serine phosphatase RsbU (regulator of sigma subunit)